MISHPEFFVRGNILFSHDFCEVEEKKSQIFSLPPHKNRVERDLSFFIKSLGRLIRDRWVCSCTL